MHTMHPTLLIGPADWNQTRLLRAEFDERLAQLWQAHPDAGGAIVYGNARDHGALAYLTHFTPKLEAALALIPRDGAARLLVGGGPNMVPAARPLTWVEQLAPLRNAGATAAEWAKTLPSGRPILLIGGDAMPFNMRRMVDEALGDIATVDADDAMTAARRHKRPRELGLMKEACAGLGVAVDALKKAQQAGAGLTDAVLAAEHAALQWGAQDVRSLFSADGGRTLRPFDIPVATPAEPLQVYLAVRHDGYWADGFVRLARAPDALDAAAAAMLHAMIAAAKPGASAAELASAAGGARGSLEPHPLTVNVFGNGIGLSLEETPHLSANGPATLEPGGVYSLRAGVAGDDGGAIVSAMVLVTDKGHDVLWSTSTP